MQTTPQSDYSADDTDEVEREELEKIMCQLRAFPNVWGGGNLKGKENK